MRTLIDDISGIVCDYELESPSSLDYSFTILHVIPRGRGKDSKTIQTYAKIAVFDFLSLMEQQGQSVL